MREVAPGDLTFSFVDTRILAVGIAQSYCWQNPKPEEFEITGFIGGLILLWDWLGTRFGKTPSTRI
jgi:hypothetical protein